MTAVPTRLVGNRLVLVGAVLYFGEWIGIALAPSLPTDKLGADPTSVVTAYSDSPAMTSFLAGWLSFVILGRIAFCAGLRNAFRASKRSLPLADWALGAMVVSVAIEVIDYGFVATGAWLADAGGAPDSVVALDAAGTMFFHLIIAPIGVSVFAASLAVVFSGLFPRWIGWLGIVTGGLLVVGGIEASAAAGSTGVLRDLGNMPIPLFWIWMIATAVVMFRATPKREAGTA